MDKEAADTTERAEAERIGLMALVFITEDPARLGRFLDITGLSPNELKAAAGTPEGQAAVLDHLLGDESLLMVFAAGAGIEPADVDPAREALAGGSGAPRRASSAAGSHRSATKRPSKRWPGSGG